MFEWKVSDIILYGLGFEEISQMTGFRWHSTGPRMRKDKVLKWQIQRQRQIHKEDKYKDKYKYKYKQKHKDEDARGVSLPLAA